MPEKEANRVLWELKMGDTDLGSSGRGCTAEIWKTRRGKALTLGSIPAEAFTDIVVVPQFLSRVNTLPVQAF
jgi:hypothetical protein